MEEEIWKSVVGYEGRYEGRYEVSNMGRVKSLGNDKGRKEKILKGALDSNGYRYVILCNEGATKTIMVHQLIAIAFLNHVLGGNTIVLDHINGIKDDNRVENIRIVTNRFNCTYGFRKNKNSLTSQYPGVNWHKGNKRWRSVIRINGKQKHLGTFKTEIDAANAYQESLSNII